MNFPLLRTVFCLLALSVSARAQTVLFSESFENGLANWSATGFWHVESIDDTCVAHVQPLPDGAHCAYYGIAGVCNYNNPPAPSNHGELTLLVPIAIPAGGPAASLHCWTRQNTEPCIYLNPFDNFNIELSSNGGTSWTIIGRRCGVQGQPSPEGIWSPRGIDLSSHMGQSILLRFTFDTGDDGFNTGLGAFVDKIEVRTEAGQPFCTSTCPCIGPFNDTAMGYGNMSGCRNSDRREGELAGGGMPSVANDTLVLTASQLVAPGAALFLQATGESTGNFNGDGRFCLSGSSVRLAIRSTQTGAISLPDVGDPPLSVLGSIPAVGATVRYQVVYRDTADYWCTSATINHTNGYRVTWMP